MAMYYTKIHFSFWDHPKTEILKEDYLNAPVHENYDAICRALFKLWSYCKERQHDGRLIMSARRLAKTADWKAAPDKLIKILTNDDVKLLDIIPGGYQIHNWYKNNPDLDPNRLKDISNQNSKAAHVRHHKNEMQNLETNGVELEKCDWLYIKEGRIAVKLKKLPKYVFVADEEFHKKSHFDERFRNSGSKTRSKLLGGIVKHTRACSNCGAYHINQELKECYDCQGGE